MSVTIRPAVAADTEPCGRIIYDAFKGIADRHGFPPHLSSVEAAIQRAKFCISHPAIFGVVAESDGQVIGSNFLDERDPIRGWTSYRWSAGSGTRHRPPPDGSGP